MIKAFWFVIKVGVIVAIALWISQRPGSVSVDWMDYKVTVHIGIFMLVAFAFVLLGIILYSTMRTVTTYPKRYQHAREIAKRDKGYQALTAGLSAIAAGDAKLAQSHARKAAALLEQKSGRPAVGLVHLLEAQTARLSGDNDKAYTHFQHLLEHKDSAFLGIRGLLQDALAHQDYEGAELILDKALSDHPKTDWLLQTAYDVKTRQRKWEKARALLKPAVKYGAFSKDKAAHERAAIITAELHHDIESIDIDAETKPNEAFISKAKRAVKTAPDFIPAVKTLVELYIQAGQQKRARTLIEKTWQISPHPDLVRNWRDVLAPSKRGKLDEEIQWMEKLVVLNPQASTAHKAVGKMCMEQSLWGEARTYLETTLTLNRSDTEVYELLARLEKRSGHGEDAAQKWRDLRQNAGVTACWHCKDTGQIFAHWQGFSHANSAFNTIVWGVPNMIERVTAKRLIA